MKQRFFLIICILFITTLSACKKINSPEEINKADEQQVTLRLLLPQQSDKAGTYAISEVDQNTIHTLDILAFKVADDGKEYYAYRKKGVLLSPSPTAGEVNFHVDLLKSEDKYRFVLIANAAAQLQAIPEKATTNTEKESLLSSINYTITAGWNANSSTNFTPLSMWGESTVINGISNNTSGFNVSMLRSLAAIDVTVSAPDFVMERVYVYNMPNKGRVVPLPANYDAASRSVTAPSLVTGTTALTAVNYVSGATELSNSIFLFEAAAAQYIGQSTATGLVIAGKYAGSAITTYYRIDLADEQDKPFPILRNHRYTIDISKVHGDGFGSQATAWSSKSMNINATVVEWKEGYVPETNSTLNYLKVSMDSITIARSAKTLSLEVRTNDLAAMTLTDIPNWVTVTRQNNPEKAVFTLNIPTYTYPQGVRVAKLAVNAGRIKKIITIIQSPPPIDIGLPFLVSGSNLSGTKVPWHKRANVEYGLHVNMDASQTQKPGTPYAESCAALGPGYRLPTYNELIQLVPPASPSERENIDTQLASKGGAKINNTNLATTFLSSSTASNQGNYALYLGLSNLSGGTGSNGVYSTGNYPKSSYVWNSEIARCVMSKSNAPPL
ncbi:FimB/Mfa2 family fimbrial subunit [Sphingobacterium spiritivorum]|uniref:FimB/Mfa2 family fimbrial subunit n=1 Tax=Sphingobacterium spiritivorum TaxID=258 RepID=UPI001917C1DA|nr:FimB/Mfa2 family fimbrial subunit [Sphingobacterium spiritivorum]QQT24248.1 DUF4906 domain-containing protein [Sphingobacterium spiritivorum]